VEEALAAAASHHFDDFFLDLGGAAIHPHDVILRSSRRMTSGV
jgi:hypothetical protein